MSKFTLFFFLCSALVATTASTGEAPFRGDRRPGILAAATDEPTGENALIYRRLGKLRPNELLDLLSETPESH